MRVSSSTLKYLAVTAILLLPGCDSGSAEENFFEFVIDQFTPLAAGEFEHFNIFITRHGDVGPVSLSASQVPSGITVTFDSNNVRGGVATGVVSVGSSVAASTYHFFVNGTASGVPDVSSEATVVVGAAAQYSLTASPDSVVIAAGSSGTTTLTFTRQAGFTDDIFPSAIVPTGITVTFAPDDVTGTSSVATITVAGGTAPGNYVVQMHGIVSGSPDQTARVAVTVH